MTSNPPSSPSPPPAAAAAEDEPRPTAAAASSSAAAASPAGFIFICSGATKAECYRHRVLGLPRGRMEAVSRIRRGTAVFLYDFDARRLYGPYRADSDGGADLVPGAFGGRFPAQVGRRLSAFWRSESRNVASGYGTVTGAELGMCGTVQTNVKFMIDGDFMPLPESSLKSAIKENYLNGKFSPELTSTQVEKLRALFQPINLPPESSPPHDVDNWPPAAFLPPSAHTAQPSADAHHPTTYAAPATSMVSQPSPPTPTSSLPRKRPHSLTVAEVDSAHPRASSSTAAASPAGFIFMCSSATKPDCYRHRVLGLPRGGLEAVSQIRRGAAVFLYDFDTKLLYGPYQADSDGGADLVPGAFHGRFPAQVGSLVVLLQNYQLFCDQNQEIARVKFMIDGDFMPVPESSLRSAIKENYFKGKFCPELTSTQVEKVRALFQPITSLLQSSSAHDIDNWPPAPAFLPPTLPAQPLAYAHHPTAYAPSLASHLVPPEVYVPACSYPPLTQQYMQAPLPCSLYDRPSMSQYASAPVYSTGPYCQNDPYRLVNVDSRCQQSTYERDTYCAGHDMVAPNLQAISGPVVNRPWQELAYTAHAAGSGAYGASEANSTATPFYY
ncbi:hypothetical protein HU200_038369 [Digitaria exilis]|uniref:DCD domain-containing protein n=1 Tax=Digitaria exilis TaxID=1010633 RepID=A0A835BP07_9POAL|nr:hypothetical protein HU200_038369 [Digitaria exilis]